MSSEFWVGPHDDPDRVRLGPAVASGAEGVLYRGTLDSEDGPVDVAVKMLQPGHLDRLAEWTLRWREQVELLQGSEVPGLVNVRGGFVGPLPHSQANSDPSTSSLYLVMDWVDGVSLDRWARSLDEPEPEQLLLALLPVAVALDMLHSGVATAGVAVVHRDVKPANILIRSGGDTVLVDIGSVRGLAEDSRRSGVVGTAGYIAPEVRYDGNYGPAADRYSLGAVAFFLLTGSEPPVEATIDELRQRLADSPTVEGRPDVVDHVLAMLDVDPENRPTPLANWVAQLRRSSLMALSGDVALAPRAPGRNPRREVPSSRLGARRSRTRRRILTATGVLILLMGVGLAVTQLRDRDHPKTASFSSSATPTTSPAYVSVATEPPTTKKGVLGSTTPSSLVYPTTSTTAAVAVRDTPTTPPAQDPRPLNICPTERTLAQAVVDRGASLPIAVQNIRCVDGWALANVIDPQTGNTDSLNVFKGSGAAWTSLGEIYPECASELRARGMPGVISDYFLPYDPGRCPKG